MKKLILISPFLLLVGCVQLVPNVKQTSPNTYYLKTNGSAMASFSTLQGKLERKAESICKGKGYQKIDEDKSFKQSTAYTAGMAVPVGQIFAEMNIKCNE